MKPESYIANDFSGAARSYNDYANLQFQVANKLKSLLSLSEARQCVLNAGGGTGFGSEPHWFHLDIAYLMCAKKPASICADMQSLPLKHGAMQGIFSSLALQWLSKPEQFFAEAARVAGKNGWLAFSTLLPGSLKELDDAYKALGCPSTVNQFESKESLFKKLEEQGWKLEIIECDTLELAYPSLMALLQSLKFLGARQKQRDAGAFKGKNFISSLEQSYPFKKKHNTIATWQLLYVKAFMV